MGRVGTHPGCFRKSGNKRTYWIRKTKECTRSPNKRSYARTLCGTTELSFIRAKQTEHCRLLTEQDLECSGDMPLSRQRSAQKQKSGSLAAALHKRPEKYLGKLYIA